MKTVYTEGNTALTLKQPALGKGGEGEVYAIDGHPGKVAKLYLNEEMAASRKSKIGAMVTIRHSDAFVRANLTKSIAWPWAPLYDQKGSFVGFGMDCIQVNMELDDLYEYPPDQNKHITIEDKINCLISICSVIEKLHSTGSVFGDFNPNNIKINKDFTVTFVDADSYHIGNRKEYRCSVCAEGYVAPEIVTACHGTTYADCPTTTFTVESDNFALAIHIFRMLMNGCHPYYTKRHLKRTGSKPVAKKIDRKVEDGETAFFKPITNVSIPDYAPDIKAFPSYIYSLFERAFVYGHSNPKARPSASEWKNALLRYKSEIKPCCHNRAHYHWNGVSNCPYCDADSRFNSKGMKFSTKSATTPAPVITYNRTAPQTNSIASSATVTYTQPIRTQTNKYQTTSATTSDTCGRFWFITITLSIILQTILGFFALSPMVSSIIHGGDVVTAICVTSALTSGLIGTIVYNKCWSDGDVYGYTAKDYILSLLTSLGFTLGLLLIIGAIALVVGIIIAIIPYVIVIGILLALLGG